MSEKRAYPRVPIDLYAYYSLAGAYPMSQKATIINISAGGFCFYTKEQLDVDTLVKLTVETSTAEKIELMVRLIWWKEIGDSKRFSNGVEIFEKSGTDYEKFLSYYGEHMREGKDPA